MGRSPSLPPSRTKRTRELSHQASLVRLSPDNPKAANAGSQAHVDGALYQPFPIGRGVAQGCPLSPFLYAVFIESVLDDLCSHLSLIHI